MSSLDRIKIELQGIGTILNSLNLVVPRYQRSYAWENQNVLDLFQDIADAIAEGSSEYFLGSIVITEISTKCPEVVDGQQRLATSTILLAAIRDYFYANNDEGRARNIHDNYLVKSDLETLEDIPRLQLNESDHNYFAQRVLSWPDSQEQITAIVAKESHKRIDDAAKLARSHVRKIASLSKNPTKRLIELVNYVKSGAKVILVQVPDDANAFTIFETLNDRGLPLAISDLLKNYLFHLSGDRINEIQQWWISMISTLESVDNEEIIVTYIRHLWSSKYGLVRERKLYQAIKEKITSRRSAIEFAQELNIGSRLYAGIISTNHEIWNKYGDTAREYMTTLNDLRMIQIRPLILAVLEKFDVKETRKALKLMVSWSVRFLIYGGLGGGALEGNYCQRAVEIREGKITTARALQVAMSAIIPTDNQFKQSFANARVSKQYLARYYLQVLERQILGQKEPELVPNTNADSITLEHILPESPSDAWGHIDQEVASSYYRRIGNLTLLPRKINAEVGNQGFNAKRPYFEESKLKLTNSLAQYPKWGIEEIEERQKYLADMAIKAWPNKVT